MATPRYSVEPPTGTRRGGWRAVWMVGLFVFVGGLLTSSVHPALAERSEPQVAEPSPVEATQTPGSVKDAGVSGRVVGGPLTVDRAPAATGTAPTAAATQTTAATTQTTAASTKTTASSRQATSTTKAPSADTKASTASKASTKSASTRTRDRSSVKSREPVSVPTNRTDRHTSSRHVQGRSAGPYKQTSGRSGRSSRQSALLPFTPTDGSVVFGALAGGDADSVQRAESYLLDDTGETQSIDNGTTVTFTYDITPESLEASDTAVVVSELVGPAKRTGEWAEAIASVEVADVDGAPQFQLCAGTDGDDGEGVTIPTGVAATSGVTRQVVFTTVIAGPGIGQSELEIDGEVVATIQPTSGTAVNEYTVAKYGVVTQATDATVDQDRWVVFSDVDITVEDVV